MSVLTKVFVVLLTVLSIALSMLVVATFAQQENFKASAQDWRTAALDMAAKERTVSSNAAIERQRAMDRHLQATRTIDALRDKVKQLEAEIGALAASRAESENKLAVEQGQVDSANRLAALVQAAFNSEQQLTTKLSRRNSELERRNVDLNNRIKELTSSVAMAGSQIRALKEQIAAMTQDQVAALPVQMPGGPGVVQARIPSVAPPSVVAAMSSPIRAEVTEVEGELAEISVGSADGVAHGMTFLIYRGGSKQAGPKYLGTLRITRVEANRSAGILEQTEGEVRKGDSARDEASFALRN